jgi:O-antigen ligase
MILAKPSFDRKKIIEFCRSATDWILLFLVFWLPLSFAFFHETLNVFALNKAVVLRVFVTLAALLFLGKTFLAGKLEYRFGRWVFIISAVLAGSWLVSAFFSPINAFGFWGNYERQLGFFTLIFFWLFFFILIFSLENISQLKRYLIAAFFSSFLACAYGLIQFSGLDLIKWAETGRIFSTLGQPNFFGHWLILIIPFSVYGIIFWARRISTRSMLAVLILLQIYCLVLTYSRSAWLGLAAEIFFGLLLFLFWQGRKKIAFGLIIFTLAGVIFASSLISFSPRPAYPNHPLLSRVSAAFDLSQGSVKARLNTWQAAASIFKEESLGRKLFGYGPDSLAEFFARHYQGSWSLDDNINTWPDRVHNIFGDIVLSFGLFGLFAYLLFCLYFFRQGWIFFKIAPRDDRFWLAAACVLALIGYFFNNLLSFSDIPEYLYFYLILGSLAFLFAYDKEKKELKIKLAVFSRLIIYIFFFVLAAIFIVYFNLRPLWADHYFIRAANRINYYCAGALDDNNRAIAWGGGNSLFYQGEYLVAGMYCFNNLPQEEQNKLKENMLFYLGSLPVEKYFIFAKYQAKTEAMFALKGDQFYADRAEKDFAALALKYPQLSEIYEDWAGFELEEGRNDEAIDIANKGLQTLPLDALAVRGFFPHRPEIEEQQINYYLILGTAEEQKNNPDSALDFYQKIIAVNPGYSLVYKKIADVYYRKKDLDKALWYNKSGYLLSPKDSSWPMAIGLLYEEQGNKNSAIEYFEKVLVLDPNNKDAQKQIDDLNK